MNGPYHQYAAVTRAVDAIFDAPSGDNDLSRKAYQIARSALLLVRSVHGAERAAEMAYSLADEMATERRG